ncbi:MAG: FAD-dependent oxidoreductase [Coprobacillus sp.]|nr:FAD-dependent oxidoreductase [Coprobacillus sp.]
MSELYDCLVIGAGPGGLRAARELQKARLSYLLFEKDVPGGKVNIAPEVDNYPGIKKINGPELAMKLYDDATLEGVDIRFEGATSLTKEDDIFTLVTENDKTYRAKTVIIASGTVNRLIGLDKEKEFLGHGISYCSLCDGHFFKGEDVAVIGGGNVALKETIHLATLVNHLYLIHRRNEFRGFDYLVKEVKEIPNVEILTPYNCIEILGESEVEGIVIKNAETGELKTLNVSGLFPLVGQIPNSQFVKIDGCLNESGTFPIDEKTRETKVANLFAIGDITERLTRQIYIAEIDATEAVKTIVSRLKK